MWSSIHHLTIKHNNTSYLIIQPPTHASYLIFHLSYLTTHPLSLRSHVHTCSCGRVCQREVRAAASAGRFLHRRWYTSLGCPSVWRTCSGFPARSCDPAPRQTGDSSRFSVAPEAESYLTLCWIYHSDMPTMMSKYQISKMSKYQM